jgi:hypothetical protein
MGLYLGMKEKARPQIFESEAEPTKETRPQYDLWVIQNNRRCKAMCQSDDRFSLW